MHLTNYAVNKKNEKFEFNSDASAIDEGSKWTLEGFREWCLTNGYDYDCLWSKISQMCVKTVAAIQPHLETNYNTVSDAMTKMNYGSAAARPRPANDNNGDHGFHCFEMLGLDVLIDSKMEPWLVEVNHSPSLTVDTPLDRQIKEALIRDTLTVVGIDGKAIKKHKKQMKDSVKVRLYGEKVKSHAPGTKSSTLRNNNNVTESSSNNATSFSVKASSSSPSYEGYMAWRLKYEQKHCGQYERIYPIDDDALMAKYESYLQAAREHYAGCVQNRVRETLDRIHEQAKVRLTVAACKAARSELLSKSWSFIGFCN